MNKELWQKIYENNYPKLLKNMTARMRGDRAGAEDTVQSVFANLMAKYPDNPDAIESIGGFLQVASMNLNITQYRRETRFVSADDIFFEELPDHLSTENDVFSSIRSQLLMTAINGLSPEYIPTMKLLIKGFGYQEIADQLGDSVGTISGRISKAKDRLKKDRDYLFL